MARIALVKPDKAKGVEDVILRGAQYGQITEKVCFEMLLSRSCCSNFKGYSAWLELSPQMIIVLSTRSRGPNTERLQR